MRLVSFLVAYDAILYSYAGTSQLLAYYSIVAMLIDRAKRR